ncbi:exonuclease SbcCD subunit D [Clostridium sp. A1-XYC3]|uniref:Nuclease SbcCD subunit D n=1 Tax=Clostridium tanneri TaxID=3037988 RepID=A0ABU4JWZ2_9CLOT|nr:exonuclease SbcCD subunit D [Clostridium sp. A1-XYC3]MDW8802657.1 exonuclease SbcCD subunit D [Clostridium sp. A1-XYC3]
MKIIHTGDWHIGKIVSEFSMIEEQQFILEQLIKVIQEEKPSALIIAGDLYDRSMPPVEAVKLLDKVFSRILLELKVPILAIAGNHDSAERLSFGSKILTKNGLHIAGVVDREVRKVVIEDEEGPVNFYLVPYGDPREIKYILQEEEISTHDNSMKKIIENVKKSMSENERSVMIAHGYVTFMKDEALDSENEDVHKKAGLQTSESERPLSIGGTDLISGEYFNCFNYTALGHLHRPQKVGSDRIRYSGSLLKYSFSERDHKKGVTVVNINGKGEVFVELRELTPRRDMRIIKGPINELINPEVYKQGNVEDYVYAILTDEGELVDPISKLRAVYPNIMGLRREELGQLEESRTSASKGYREKAKLQLFGEFYKAIGGKELTEDKLNIMKKIIEEVEKEGK